MTYADLQAMGIVIDRGSLANGFQADMPRTVDRNIAFCRRGHAKTPDNVYMSGGKATCKTCQAMHNARASAIRREARRLQRLLREHGI